jgi:Ser/Thr protein kinase RdoA (MazF antagonist)
LHYQNPQIHNLIVKDNIIIGVLDWGNAKYGDFAYDIMWSAMHGPEVVNLKELVSAYESAGFDNANIEKRLMLCKVSVLISWAMFSNEIGNFANSQADQKRLAETLESFR